MNVLELVVSAIREVNLVTKYLLGFCRTDKLASLAVAILLWYTYLDGRKDVFFSELCLTLYESKVSTAHIVIWCLGNVSSDKDNSVHVTVH